MPRPAHPARATWLAIAIVVGCVLVGPVPAAVANPRQGAPTTTTTGPAIDPDAPDTSGSDPWVMAVGVVIVTAVGVFIVARVRRARS